MCVKRPLGKESSPCLLCCFSQGLQIRQIRFRFDGQPINETDTPAQVRSRSIFPFQFFNLHWQISTSYTAREHILKICTYIFSASLVKLYIDLFLVVVILCIHSLILLFSAGDGRRRHHRCIPAADRRLLLNPLHLFGSHFQIFPSVTFTVPLLVSDYYYDYDYSSLHLKKFLMVPSGVVWGCFMYCLKLDWTLCMSTVSAGQAEQGFFLAPQLWWTDSFLQLFLAC